MRFLMLAFGLFFGLGAGAVELEIDHVLDSTGSFLNCTLEDGRELSSHESLVSVDHEILAKSLDSFTVTDDSFKATYLGWQYKATVIRARPNSYGPSGIVIEYIDGDTKPVGTIERLKCSP